MGRLAGKVAVITGATSGIGKGTARRFVREGATVVFNARTESSGLQTEEELRSLVPGAKVKFIRADISIKSDIQGVVEYAIKTFGRIDALINNAQGIPPLRSIMNKPDEDHRYSLESGFFASKWAMQAAFPAMREQGGGSIVNTTSVWGIICPPNASDYSANKAAIEALTRSAAQEWGRYNINVNVVAPSARSAGYLVWAKANPEVARAVSEQNPLKRLGDPEHDLGSLALGLVTEDARFITGQTFCGGGGNSFLRRIYSGTGEMESVDFQAKQ